MLGNEAAVIDTDDADHRHRVNGLFYKEFLANLQSVLHPHNYLEIGTLAGDTLKNATCSSIAVDPQFQIASDVIGRKPACMFFQETSDDFFRCHNPTQLFGAPIDMAFLDGMHIYEFLLRDFINTERHCRKNSIVVLHDCLPPGFYMTVRAPGDPLNKNSRFSPWWTGDVWKIVPVLQQYRPDLSVTVVDCPPTGLILITNLDPKNTYLTDRHSEIAAEWSSPHIDRDQYDRYWQSVKITPSSELMSLHQLSARFWL